MRKFEIGTDPEATGQRLYNRKDVELEPGITVLVGCNGYGKSTFIRAINEKLTKERIPVMTFDGLKDNSQDAIGNILGFGTGDFSEVGLLMTSSEGENVMNCFSRKVPFLRNFIRTGIIGDTKNKIKKVFVGEDAEITTKERWLLLDGLDSGLSINSLVYIKNFIHEYVLPDVPKDIELYIIISTNAYEFASHERCYDVKRGKYLSFQSYSSYRQFILDTAKAKEKRLDAFNEKQKNPIELKRDVVEDGDVE